MPRKSYPLYPQTQRRTEALGERLRLARMRRRMSLTEMAARVGVARGTLTRLEQGHPSVGFGLLAKTLTILGLEEDLDSVARDDELGRRIQDAQMRRPRQTTRRGDD